MVYENDYRESVCLKKGKDITLFATGSMVSSAIKAAQIVEKKIKASVKVVNMHTIAPIDIGAINNALSSKLVVSVEEHHIVGGLGSAIADVISCYSNTPPLLKLGIGMQYSEVGDYEYLLKQHRLNSEMIAEDIVKKYSQL